MSSGSPPPPGRFLFVFTTYPAPTETFLQREVAALRELGADVTLASVWGGGGNGVQGFRFWQLIGLLWHLPLWLWRKPAVFGELAEILLLRSLPTTINAGENLLGIGWAVCSAKRVREAGFTHLHGVWAGLPGAAVWLLSRLTGIPYSIGGHAYDLFEGGGDWWLDEKVRSAEFVRSSTEAGCARLREAGAEPSKVHRIRRGFFAVPAYRDTAGGTGELPPFRVLAVGRFVEKMGHAEVVETIIRLHRRGVPVAATIIGDGPLRAALLERIRALRMENVIRLPGHVPNDAVFAQLREADAFLFMGQVARSGDRAGFPNALAEAMAVGVPVVARPVGGVAEIITDGKNGLLVADPAAAAAALERLRTDPALAEDLRRNARGWIQHNFDARRQMANLLFLLSNAGSAGGIGDRALRPAAGRCSLPRK